VKPLAKRKPFTSVDEYQDWWLQEHVFDDYATGAAAFGIPDAYYMSRALYDGNYSLALYYAQVMGAVHLTWFTAWNIVSLWDIFRHGGKNIKGLSFHKAMQGKGVLAGRALRSVFLNPPAVLAESTYYQRELWQYIGDEKTGAIHYSGAGDIGSGGSMPVVPELESFSWRSIKREFGFD
jgi:hypothetical protein